MNTLHCQVLLLYVVEVLPEQHQELDPVRLLMGQLKDNSDIYVVEVLPDQDQQLDPASSSWPTEEQLARKGEGEQAVVHNASRLVRLAVLLEFQFSSYTFLFAKPHLLVQLISLALELDLKFQQMFHFPHGTLVQNLREGMRPTAISHV